VQSDGVHKGERRRFGRRVGVTLE